MASGITPDLPLEVTPSDGAYALIKTPAEAIVQDLKNLILTIPGEKMMDPDFGVGLRRYLFEQQDSAVYVEIQTRLSEQVDKYLPVIRILGVSFNVSNDSVPSDMIDNGILYMRLVFEITSLSLVTSLDIGVGDYVSGI